MKSGWQTKSFEDCIGKVTYSSKIQRKDFLDDGAYPIVSQEDAFINGYWDNEADLFKVTTPIVVFGDHTKVLKYVDFDFVLGADGVKVLQPREFLFPKFFFYQLQTANLDSLGYARHYRLLRELDIVYPDRAEQQRIVSILDQAFEAISKACANAEANLKNARAIFDSHLQSVFTQRGDSHIDRRLVEVCNEITVGHVGSMAAKYKAGGIPFLRSQNIRPFQISLDNLVFIDEFFHQSLAKSQLKPGDVAIVRTGYPGTAAVIPDSLPMSNCSDLVIVRPGPTADPHYLALFFNSSHGKELVAGNLVGAAQKHFNITAAKQVSIPFPPVIEQRRLVAKLEVFGVETQRLESLYRRKLEALDELKRSLLHQAFSGQL